MSERQPERESEATFTAEAVEGIGRIGRETWNRLAPPGHPFLSYEWLHALEDTGCVHPNQGWLPLHLLLREGDRVVGLCPFYLKSHSMGEFIFDQEWAHASERMGVEYYPKGLSAVPFTPVTGPRFLLDPERPREPLIRAMARALPALGRRFGLSSVHLNFLPDDEAALLEEPLYLARGTVQYHWRNRGYRDFEDYLQALKGKRRGEIRRERRRLHEAGVRFRVLAGDEILPRHMAAAYELYAGHVAKFFWGQRYLNRDFFQRIGETFREHLMLVWAERDGQLLGGAINVRGGDRLYGRYWGARVEDVPFLHFAACYYEGIDFCIREGLSVFEPGAGGEFKRMRGFDPVITHSAHHIADPLLREAIGRFLVQERQLTREYRDELLARGQYRASDEEREAGEPPEHGEVSS